MLSWMSGEEDDVKPRPFPMGGERGVTLVELIVTITILAILGSLVIPSARLTVKRTKEIELRRSLREIRLAIDAFKKEYDKAVEQKKIIPSLNKSGYPEEWKQLVEGYDFGGLYPEKKKFLRRIPRDPFSDDPDPERQWGLRSYYDQPDSRNWGGEDIYDVYSLSNETALDGTKYADW